MLDLRLMRVPSFAISVWAGSLTRITGGALPFLLPMMLQLGFGDTAARSGLITFSSAAGAMLMKAAAPAILRRWGFRATLMWNGVLATLLLMSAALFRPSVPVAVISWPLRVAVSSSGRVTPWSVSSPAAWPPAQVP